MASLFEMGAGLIASVFQASCSTTVTYQRGVSTVELAATIDRTVFELDDGGGVIDRVETRDFLLKVQELILAGLHAIPRRGDLIIEVLGGETFTREVGAPAAQKHVEYDEYRNLMRVRTWNRQPEE